ESSGGRSTHRALVWGGVFTGLGSLIAVLVAEQLLSVFTSTLLTPTPSDDFVLAVLLGTTAWVLGATLMRLPVSLTHAIIGAILFETAYLFGASHLAWAAIGLRVLLPLAGGPFAALFLTYLLHRRKRNKSPPPPEAETPGHTGKVAGLGSIGWGRRVTRTLVGRLVPMARDRHVTAGVTTAALVSLGAILGAPLSTTHVASGATTGIGGGRKEHVRSTLKGFLLAWFVTLPAAGLLAIGASFAVSWLQPYLG
ncbi:inorganic phosphate transporter, partial [Candidatus Bathyarchaeota archaeon]